MKLWVARDYRGLYIFENRPHLVIDRFHSHGFILLIQADKFLEITFENSPQMIEVNLTKTESNYENVDSKR